MFNTTSNVDRRQFVKLGLAGFAALAGVGLAGCGAGGKAATTSAASGSAAGSAAAAASAKELILGFDKDFPPYGYVGDDGQYTGFDIDLAAKVCELEGWKFTPTPISWDAKDALLNSGQINCIWNGFTVEGREDSYTFTAPYMENRQVVVVKADSKISDLKGLSGKNVITQADSAAYDLLAEDGAQAELGKTFAKLDTIDNYNTAFTMMESGQVDAIAVDYPVAVFNIGDKKDIFTILDEPLNSEHFAVGFAKTDDGAALAKTIEGDLKKLDEQGFVKDLCSKYADQGVSYDLWILGK